MLDKSADQSLLDKPSKYQENVNESIIPYSLPGLQQTKRFFPKLQRLATPLPARIDPLFTWPYTLNRGPIS